MAGSPNRGEIWMYEFSPPDKRRPVLVLTRSESIRYLSHVTIAPLTRTIRGGPSQVELGVEVGLKGPSAVNLHQVTTVPKSTLRRFVGAVSAAEMDAVCRAMGFAFACGAYAAP